MARITALYRAREVDIEGSGKKKDQVKKKKLNITKIMPMKQTSEMEVKLLHKKAAPGERGRSGLGKEAGGKEKAQWGKAEPVGLALCWSRGVHHGVYSFR